MVELLWFDSPKMYGNHHPGCIRVFFPLFGFLERRENRKLLAYKRIAEENYGTDIITGLNDIPIVSDGAQEDALSHNGACVQVENNEKRTLGSSGKARILNFIGKKMSKRHKHKAKMSHSSAQLMRTVSIHRLEYDYVPPGESSHMTSDSETSTITVSSDANSFTVNEQDVDGWQGVGRAVEAAADISLTPKKLCNLRKSLIDEHIILKAKLLEARDALLKQKDTDPNGVSTEFAHRSKIFLDQLHLFNNNREAIGDLCNGQHSFFIDELAMLKNPAEARVLNKSASLARLDFDCSAVGVAIPSNKPTDIGSLVNQGPALQSGNKLPGNVGVVFGTEVLRGSHEQRKQESNTVLNRLRNLKQRIKDVIEYKEHKGISRDGIMHKVPVGHKLLEDDKGVKQNLRKEAISESGQGLKFSSAALHPYNKKVANNSIKRSQSLSESLPRYSHLFDIMSGNEGKKAPVRSNSVREGSSLSQVRLTKTFERMLSNPEWRSYSFRTDLKKEADLSFLSSKKMNLEPHDRYILAAADSQDTVEEISGEQAAAMESIVEENADVIIISDEVVSHSVEEGIAETKSQEPQCSLVDEFLQIEPFQISDTVDDKGCLFNEHEIQIGDETNIEPKKHASSISVVDSFIEEEPTIPDECDLREDSELQPLCMEHEQHQPLSNLFRFNFVKHILNKSGYDILLLSEKDIISSCHEADTVINMLDEMPCDEQLMFGLVNEVFLEIYEHLSAPSPWLSSLHPRIRSTPTGRNLLVEVWSEIRWHLRSIQGMGSTLDDFMALQFSRDLGWMNLFRDAECFGLLLEQLIFDDLVDEIIIDSDLC